MTPAIHILGIFACAIVIAIACLLACMAAWRRMWLESLCAVFLGILFANFTVDLIDGAKRDYGRIAAQTFAQDAQR